jgi:hypothetical protein
MPEKSDWWYKRHCASIGVHGKMGKNQSELRGYRVRRTWIVVLIIIEFLGFIPILGIFRLLPHIGKDFWPIAAIMWGTLYLFTALHLRSLHCPRCGKKYFGDFSALFGGYVAPGQRYSVFKKECINCGLGKNSN